MVILIWCNGVCLRECFEGRFSSAFWGMKSHDTLAVRVLLICRW